MTGVVETFARKATQKNKKIYLTEVTVKSMLALLLERFVPITLTFYIIEIYRFLPVETFFDMGPRRPTNNTRTGRKTN